MRAARLMGLLLVFLLCSLDIAKPAEARRFESGGWTCTSWEISSMGYTWYGPWQCTYTAPSTNTNPDSGGTSGYEEEQLYACRYLRLHRPANCPEEIPMPTAGDYGYLTAYQAGSGLAKLISLSKGGLTMPGINAQLDQALANHTAALATRAFQASEINRSLIDAVKPICEEQGSTALPGAYGTLYCFQALDRLIAENGDQTFLSYFQNWITVNHADFGIDIFSLSGLVAALSPDNSLTAKYNLVTSDSACADWWDAVRIDGCMM